MPMSIALFHLKYDFLMIILLFIAKKCVYRAKYERIDMYGMEEVTWYDYNKDGTVPERPTYHRSVDSLCFFYTMFDKDIDYVAEIEQHSPIKVTIDN